MVADRREPRPELTLTVCTWCGAWAEHDGDEHAQPQTWTRPRLVENADRGRSAGDIAMDGDHRRERLFGILALHSPDAVTLKESPNDIAADILSGVDVLCRASRKQTTGRSPA